MLRVRCIRSMDRALPSARRTPRGRVCASLYTERPCGRLTNFDGDERRRPASSIRPTGIVNNSSRVHRHRRRSRGRDSGARERKRADRTGRGRLHTPDLTRLRHLRVYHHEPGGAGQRARSCRCHAAGPADLTVLRQQRFVTRNHQPLAMAPHEHIGHAGLGSQCFTCLGLHNVNDAGCENRRVAVHAHDGVFDLCVAARTSRDRAQQVCLVPARPFERPVLKIIRKQCTGCSDIPL